MAYLSDITTYYTVAQESVAEFKDRGSRFIAYVFPVSTAAEVKLKIQSIKKAHPKAAHHCYAYRLGPDENNFRAVDDGEPSGTAGKPILGQLHSRKITNACIVVVRYFGGTLLGVPGLINAYKTAASLALEVIPVISRPLMKNVILEFDYTRMNEVMMVLKQFNCEILKHSNQLFSQIEAAVPVRFFEQVIFKLSEIQFIRIDNV